MYCETENRAKKIAEGLYIDIRVDYGESLRSGRIVYAIIFGGNTAPHKDAIKGLGAKWTDRYPTSNGISSMVNVNQAPMRWVIFVNIDKLEAVGRSALEIGARLNDIPSSDNVARLQAEIQVANFCKSKQADSLGSEPEYSETVRRIYPEGARWNGKYYGKDGHWSIYSDGNKIEISNEIKAEMEATTQARAEWENRKKQISH